MNVTGGRRSKSGCLTLPTLLHHEDHSTPINECAPASMQDEYGDVDRALL